MKWIFRFVTISLLVVAIAFPFFMKNKQGEPMLGFPGVENLSLPKLPERASIRTVYKWQDQQGVWHYGDEPPAGVTYSSLEVNDQTNVIQMLTDEERERLAPPPATTTTAAASPDGAVAPVPSPVPEGGLTVERALNIVNEAKAVRDQMEGRNRELQRVVGEP